MLNLCQNLTYLYKLEKIKKSGISSCFCTENKVTVSLEMFTRT